MATSIQNLTTTLTGLLGGNTPTNQQLTNVGAAFQYYMTDEDAINIFGHNKVAMTNLEIATFSLQRIRAFVKQTVYQAGVDASNAANQSVATASGNSNSSGL